MSYPEEPRGGTTKIIDDKHKEELHNINLHGTYFKEQEATAVINTILSKRWLDIPYFRYETDILICAAQEQALAINYVHTKIWKSQSNTQCKLCRVQNETIANIVSGCKILAGTQYMYRNNQVAKYLHWNILSDLKIKVSKSWLKHKLLESITKNGLIVMRDPYLIIDKKVAHNRPDIVIHNTTNHEYLLIDVAIPMCQNVVRKEAEKITKYRDLEIELQKCWKFLKMYEQSLLNIGALG